MLNTDPTPVVRKHQEQDDIFGGLFSSLHKFADRTLETFFPDTPEIPHPVIRFERTRVSCRGEYQPVDGTRLYHVITIDPYKCRTGENAAEVLAHELVHLWQDYVGKLPARNYHSAEFHSRLGTLGILSSGRAGYHDGFADGGVWQDWLEDNSDLQLAEYLLPYEEEKSRQLLKFSCPDCGFSFRTRRHDAQVVCMTEDCGIPMEEEL